MNIPYKVAAEAIRNAHEITDPGEAPYTVSVLDAGRNMIAFARQDGALLASVECSTGKAYASVSLGVASDELLPMILPGQPLYGLETSHRRPLVMFKGGIPVVVRGKLLGAVGVSGGPLEQDERIAKSIAKEIGDRIDRAWNERDRQAP